MITDVICKQFGHYVKECPEQEKEVRTSSTNSETSNQHPEDDSELYSEQEDIDNFQILFNHRAFCFMIYSRQEDVALEHLTI